MDMSGMDSDGGMDMGSAMMFQGTNMEIARLFWYFIAAVVAVITFRRCCDQLRTTYASRKSKSRNDIPSRPANIIGQIYDTTIAIARELTYPQPRPFTGSFTKYFSIIPLGQCLLLAAYWTMILIMLWSNVILKPSSEIYGYKWEIVGFRAAWVSVTQIPLLYCLGGKANIISMITGISYERLNWLHRWIARTIFLTVIVHWSFFFYEWWLADFVQDEFQMMPMVKYGFGAWGVIGWSVITGFGYFRTKSYELWVLQHLATVGVLLWLLYLHIPVYAQYNIWLAIGFVAFDRGARGIWSLYRNLHVSNVWRQVKGNQSLVGFKTLVKSHGNGYMSLTVHHVDFEWQAGQHVFVSMPTCGIFESHPFTITTSSSSGSSSLQLYFKCHSGFTGRLREKAESGKCDHVRMFISGPWGNPPISKINRCNTLILIGSSTGAAFTVPLLEHAIRKSKFVQKISFHWIVRHDSQLEFFMQRINIALHSAQQLDIVTECRIFITGESSTNHSSNSSINEKVAGEQILPSILSSSESSSDDSITPLKQQVYGQDQKDATMNVRSTATNSNAASINSSGLSDKQQISAVNVAFASGRPASWDALLHSTIVDAAGETVIVACGGCALVADIRNYVAWISDQRAVHKGTGAQGIALFTETYGW